MQRCMYTHGEVEETQTEQTHCHTSKLTVHTHNRLRIKVNDYESKSKHTCRQITRYYKNEQDRSTTCEAVASQTIKLPMCAVTNGTRLTGGHAQQQLITINIRNDYHLPLLLSGDSDLTNDVF